MKNLFKILIPVLILSLFVWWFFSGEKIREEVIERYDNGQKKIVMTFRGEGNNEELIQRIVYNENGDTLIFELPIENRKMERIYYKDKGLIEQELNYKDGELGKWTRYYKNGQISFEENYKNCIKS